MIIAVDIGNSDIVLGAWNKSKWISSIRFETHPGDSGRYKTEIDRFMQPLSAGSSQPAQTILSSVVPDATQPMVNVLNSLLLTNPLVLNSTIDTGLEIHNDEPEKVGTDLIADAVGAYHLIQDDCIVVDFGTATTVIAVEKPGALTGGAICPGLKASRKALADNAAQLFDVPLQPPPSVFGKNTVEAVQSGLVLGHAAMVEGLVKRMKKEMNTAQIVATGGRAELFAPLTDLFDRVEPMLTLDGLRLIAERNSAI